MSFAVNKDDASSTLAVSAYLKEILVKLSNIYDFYYKISQDDRAKLIGEKIFEVTLLNGKKNPKIHIRTFYVIGLNNMCFNYGYTEGLIGLLEPLILRFSKKQLEKYNGDSTWFKLYAKSPDDLDLSLEVLNSKSPEREFNIIKRCMDKYCTTFIDTSYRDVFSFIQEETGLGKIGL